MTVLAICILASVLWGSHLKKIRIEYWLVALSAIVIAVIFGEISIVSITDTIVGDGIIQPWKTIITFFGISYMAASLDSTGILEDIARRVTTKSNNIKQMFLYVYILAGFITLFVNNDITVIVLTHPILYFGRHTKTDIMPLLFAIFFAANIFSMVFITGDPTNIILASAMKYTFLDFSKIMLLPTILSALTAYYLLKRTFKKTLSKTVQIHTTKQNIVSNWPIAIFSAILFIFMIIMLMLSNYINVPIWAIVLSFTGLTIVKDLFTTKKHKTGFCQLAMNFNKVPWKIAPFIIFFFIYVNILSNTEIFNSLVDFIGSIPSAIGVVSIVGSISSILANIFNNQPVTMFMTNLIAKSTILENTNLFFTPLAIVIATSVGATLTTIGTLAGVMWQSILHQHGLKISYIQYLKTSIRITPIALMVGLIGLLVSISIFS